MAAPQSLTLSLIEGGPGDRLLKRLRLVRTDFGVASPRTAIILMAVTWPPLLVLSLIEGYAWGGATIPFLYDLAAHTRFLFAVPVLVLADIPIGARLRQTAGHFLLSGLVRPEDEAKFAEIVADAVRFRDSRVGELILLGCAYLASYAMVRRGPIHGLSIWYMPNPDGDLSGVGYVYAFVAIPIFQFLLLRWIYRMLVWARFLWRVSQLNLRLTPTHPDNAGGLAFLGKGTITFGMILFPLSAVISGGVASNILFAGAKLADYQQAYGALVVLAIFIFAGPLLLFAPTLMRLKQRGLLEYGVLASRHTDLFHHKWVGRTEIPEEPILGTADIQSLADLGNSYELVRKMRVVPLQLSDFVAIVLPAVIPALPLLATEMPVSEIVKTLLHLLG